MQFLEETIALISSIVMYKSDAGPKSDIRTMTNKCSGAINDITTSSLLIVIPMQLSFCFGIVSLRKADLGTIRQ